MIYVVYCLMALLPVKSKALASRITHGAPEFSSVCKTGVREDNTNYINCSSTGLRIIPDFSRYNSFCDELLLTGNSISMINRDAFRGLQVNVISFSGNPIRSVDTRAFAGLATTLDKLTLSFNPEASLNTIPHGIVRNLEALSSLWLEGLSLATLKTDQFRDSFRKLSSLSLIRCGIASIESESLFPIVGNLIALNLTDNRIHNLNDGIFPSSSSKLESLTLNRNRLKEISAKGLKLKNLKLFSADDNAIDSIHKDAFMNLPSLTELRLANNRLKHIDFVTPLAKLELLDLSGNEIDHIPGHMFSDCTKLRYIHLDHNRLNQLNKNMLEGLYSLLDLTLDRNDLRLVGPGTFANASSLVRLDLSDNPSLSIDQSEFGGLSSLQQLALRRTGVSELSRLARSKMRMLVDLDLSENQLRAIDLSGLCIMGRLKQLNLAMNKLTQLPRMARKCTIENLILSGNLIPDPPTHMSYSKIKYLEMDSVDCHCMTSDEDHQHILSFTAAWNISCRSYGADDPPSIASGSRDCLPVWGSSKAPTVRLITAILVRTLDKSDYGILIKWDIGGGSKQPISTDSNNSANLTLMYHVEPEERKVLSTVSIPLNPMSRQHVISPILPNAKYVVCIQAQIEKQSDMYCRNVVTPAWMTAQRLAPLSTSITASGGSYSFFEFIYAIRYIVLSVSVLILAVAGFTILISVYFSYVSRRKLKRQQEQCKYMVEKESYSDSSSSNTNVANYPHIYQDICYIPNTTCSSCGERHCCQTLNSPLQ